jgi:hypothetical protein
MSDRVPSDGGGKAAEWLISKGNGLLTDIISGPDCSWMPVVEKEWADRQLAEVLDVIEKAAGDHSMAFQHERDELRLAARQLRRKHGRTTDA